MTTPNDDSTQKARSTASAGSVNAVAGHILAAMEEARTLESCHRLYGSAAMITLRKRLALALAETACGDSQNE